MPNDLKETWRFRHSNLVSAPAEKAEQQKVPDVDFGGQFEDDPRAVREGKKLSLVTKQRLLALAIARTTSA